MEAHLLNELPPDAAEIHAGQQVVETADYQLHLQGGLVAPVFSNSTSASPIPPAEFGVHQAQHVYVAEGEDMYGRPEMKSLAPSRWNSQASQSRRRLKSRQGRQKLTLRKDVVMLLMEASDKLNKAQAQMEYRKALKRQAQSLQQRGMPLEAQVLNDLSSGIVPPELQQLLNTQENVHTQNLSAIHAGERPVARLPSLYRNAAQSVHGIMEGLSAVQQWGYFKLLPRTQKKPAKQKVDFEQEAAVTAKDDVEVVDFDNGRSSVASAASSGRKEWKVAGLEDGGSWQDIVRQRKKEKKYKELLATFAEIKENLDRNAAARLIQRTWRMWKADRYLKAGQRLQIMREEADRRLEIQDTLHSLAHDVHFSSSISTTRSFSYNGPALQKRRSGVGFGTSFRITEGEGHVRKSEFGGSHYSGHSKACSSMSRATSFALPSYGSRAASRQSLRRTYLGQDDDGLPVVQGFSAGRMRTRSLRLSHQFSTAPETPASRLSRQGTQPAEDDLEAEEVTRQLNALLHEDWRVVSGSIRVSRRWPSAAGSAFANQQGTSTPGYSRATSVLDVHDRPLSYTGVIDEGANEGVAEDAVGGQGADEETMGTRVVNQDVPEGRGVDGADGGEGSDYESVNADEMNTPEVQLALAEAQHPGALDYEALGQDKVGLKGETQEEREAKQRAARQRALQDKAAQDKVAMEQMLLEKEARQRAAMERRNQQRHDQGRSRAQHARTGVSSTGPPQTSPRTGPLVPHMPKYGRGMPCHSQTRAAKQVPKPQPKSEWKGILFLAPDAHPEALGAAPLPVDMVGEFPRSLAPPGTPDRRQSIGFQSGVPYDTTGLHTESSAGGNGPLYGLGNGRQALPYHLSADTMHQGSGHTFFVQNGLAFNGGHQELHDMHGSHHLGGPHPGALPTALENHHNSNGLGMSPHSLDALYLPLLPDGEREGVNGPLCVGPQDEHDFELMWGLTRLAHPPPPSPVAEEHADEVTLTVQKVNRRLDRRRVPTGNVAQGQVNLGGLTHPEGVHGTGWAHRVRTIEELRTGKPHQGGVAGHGRQDPDASVCFQAVGMRIGGGGLVGHMDGQWMQGCSDAAYSEGEQLHLGRAEVPGDGDVHWPSQQLVEGQGMGGPKGPSFRVRFKGVLNGIALPTAAVDRYQRRVTQDQSTVGGTQSASSGGLGSSFTPGHLLAALAAAPNRRRTTVLRPKQWRDMHRARSQNALLAPVMQMLEESSMQLQRLQGKIRALEPQADAEDTAVNVCNRVSSMGRDVLMQAMGAARDYDDDDDDETEQPGPAPKQTSSSLLAGHDWHRMFIPPPLAQSGFSIWPMSSRPIGPHIRAFHKTYLALAQHHPVLINGLPAPHVNPHNVMDKTLQHIGQTLQSPVPGISGNPHRKPPGHLSLTQVPPQATIPPGGLLANSLPSYSPFVKHSDVQLSGSNTARSLNALDLSPPRQPTYERSFTSQLKAHRSCVDMHVGWGAAARSNPSSSPPWLPPVKGDAVHYCMPHADQGAMRPHDNSGHQNSTSPQPPQPETDYVHCPPLQPKRASTQQGRVGMPKAASALELTTGFPIPLPPLLPCMPSHKLRSSAPAVAAPRKGSTMARTSQVNSLAGPTNPPTTTPKLMPSSLSQLGPLPVPPMARSRTLHAGSVGGWTGTLPGRSTRMQDVKGMGLQARSVSLMAKANSSGLTPV